MATIQVRMSDEDKEAVEKILESWGMDVSTAVRAFFKRIQVDGGMPFPLKRNLTINGFTPEFEEEVLRSAAEEDGSRVFDNVEDLIADLNKGL